MPFPGGTVIGAENQTASVNNTTSIYMYNNTQLAQSTNSLPTDWGFIQLMTASVIPLILTLLLVSMCIYYRCKRKARTAGADDQRNQPEIEANQFAVDMEAIGNATYI